MKGNASGVADWLGRRLFTGTHDTLPPETRREQSWGADLDRSATAQRLRFIARGYMDVTPGGLHGPYPTRSPPSPDENDPRLRRRLRRIEHVPHEHRGVAAAGDQRLAVGREGETRDTAVGRLELAAFLRRVRVPETDTAVGTRRDERLAVGREGERRACEERGVGVGGMRDNVEQLLARRGIPESDPAGTARRGETLAVGGEGERFHVRGQSLEAAHFLTRRRVPLQHEVALLRRDL